MSLFNETEPRDTYTCKLCDRDVAPDRYISDYGICDCCSLTMQLKLNTLLKRIPKLQEQANNATTPSGRIMYLSLMLDMLYEYKIKYVENGVDAIDQDVGDLIFEVIDCISEARL